MIIFVISIVVFLIIILSIIPVAAVLIVTIAISPLVGSFLFTLSLALLLHFKRFADLRYERLEPDQLLAREVLDKLMGRSFREPRLFR